MKIIVTGGCGFIGSHLAELLVDEGHQVCVLDNLSSGKKENLSQVADRIKIIECDISKEGSWEENFNGVEWVFHLAALADIVPSIRKPEDYFKVNVDGTFNVLQASRLYGIKRFIYAASSSCYGIPYKLPVKETDPIMPQYPYALTKRLGEELVLHWDKVYKLPTLSLRLFNVYGPRSRTSGTYGAVFGVFLAQKLAEKPFTVVGDGNQTRDFTYVKDVTRAFLMAAESDKVNEVYNVGSEKEVSVNRIAELLGEKERVNIPKRPGEPSRLLADITKIKNELSWSPRISIEEGIVELLKNIDYWKNAPVWEPDLINEQTKDWFKYLGKE